MAKKKGGKKAESPLDRSASGSPADADQVEETHQASVEPPGAATDAAETDAAAESGVQQQLDSLKVENQQLKEQLAAKDAELDTLRIQLRDAAATTGVKFDRSKLEDVEKLQSRLAELRREQAEADAVRDAAWKQLKKVVGEISSLASPDFLASVNVPTHA